MKDFTSYYLFKMQPNALLIWKNLLFAKSGCYTSPTHGTQGSYGNLIPCFHFQAPLSIFVKISHQPSAMTRLGRLDRIPTLWATVVSQSKHTALGQKLCLLFLQKV
jgi:hypothetical protein